MGTETGGVKLHMARPSPCLCMAVEYIPSIEHPKVIAGLKVCFLCACGGAAAKLSTIWEARAFLSVQVARFLLRRHLGQLLRGDVDLESLDLALASGRLALRSLQLNCDYINSQLASVAPPREAQMLPEFSQRRCHFCSADRRTFDRRQPAFEYESSRLDKSTLIAWQSHLFIVSPPLIQGTLFPQIRYRGHVCDDERAFVVSQGTERGCEVVDASIGSVSARVPITSLYVDPCEVELDEVLLTVRPIQSGSVSQPASATANTPKAAVGVDAEQEALSDIAAGNALALLSCLLLHGRTSQHIVAADVTAY